MADRHIKVKVEITGTNLQALAQLNNVLTQVEAQERAMATAVSAANAQLLAQKNLLGKAVGSINQVTNAVQRNTQSIISNISKVIAWSAATATVYGALKAVGEAASDVKKVEYAEAGLLKVMQQATGGVIIQENEVKSLSGSIRDLASRYGELGSSAINATTEWARTQQSFAAITEGVKASLMAQAVAEMEVTEATGYLIAALQQFERPAQHAVSVLDSWNKMSNTYAVRTVDMAQSTAKAGSVFHNLCVSMEELNAITTILVQSTKKSGTEIGNTLKTLGVYAYRPETIAKLKQVANVDVAQKGSGDLKDFMTLMGELSSKWDTYSEKQQMAISNTMAGARRVTEFQLMMKKFPEILQATTTAFHGQGSAAKELETYMDTVKKRGDELRSSLENLAYSFAESLLPATKGVITYLNWSVNGLKEHKQLLVLMGAATLLYVAKVLKLVEALGKLRLAFMALTATNKALLIGFAALTTAISIYTAVVGRSAKIQAEKVKVQNDAIDLNRQETLSTLDNAKAVQLLIDRYEAYENLKKSARWQKMTPAEREEAVKGQQETLREITSPVGPGQGQIRNISEARAWAASELQKGEALRKSTLQSIAIPLQSAQKQANIFNAARQEASIILDEIEKATGKREPTDIFKEGAKSDELITRVARRFIGTYTRDEIATSLKAVAATKQKNIAGAYGFSQGAVGGGVDYAKILEYGRQQSEEAKNLLAVRQELIKEPIVTEGEETPEEQRDALRDVRREIERILALYEHRADILKQTGHYEDEVAKVTTSGLQAVVGYLHKQVGLHQDDEEALKKLLDMVEEYNLALELQSKYGESEAKLATAFQKQEEDFDDRIASIQEAGAVQLGYYQTMGLTEKAYQQEMATLGQVLEATKKRRDEIKSTSMAMEKQVAITRQLDSDIERQQAGIKQLKDNYETTIQPMEAYNRALTNINIQTSLNIALMEMQGKKVSAQLAEQVISLDRSIEARKALLPKEDWGADKELQSMMAERAKIARVGIPTARREEEFREYERMNDEFERTQALGVFKYNPAEQARKAWEQKKTMLDYAQRAGYKGIQLEPFKRDVYNAETAFQVAVQQLTLEDRQRAFDLERTRSATKLTRAGVMGLPERTIVGIQQQENERLKEEGKILFEQFPEEWKNYEREFKIETERLGEDFKNANAEYARDMIESYMDAFDELKAKWRDTMVGLVKGDVGGFLQAFDDIQNQILAKQMENNPMVKLLAKYEMQVGGAWQTEQQKEQERQQAIIDNMTSVFETGSTLLGDTFLSAGQQVADAIYGAMTGQKPDLTGRGTTIATIPSGVLPLGSPKGIKPGQALGPGGVSESTLPMWLPSILAATSRVYQRMEGGRFTQRGSGALAMADVTLATLGGALDQKLRTNQKWAGTGTALTTIGTDIVSNYQANRQSGRTGTGQMVGQGLGTVAGLAVGTYLGSPQMGALIGNQLGSVVGSAFDRTKDKVAKPKEESLRDVLQDTIASGSYQAASQITYNVQNTVSVDYMIPDAEQARKVVTWMKKALQDYDSNVMG